MDQSKINGINLNREGFKVGIDRNILIAMFTFVLVILTGCGSSSDEISANINNNNSTEITDDDSSNAKLSDLEEDTTENAAEGASESTFTTSDDGEQVNSSNSNSEITGGNKEEYLKKLNDMEESDKNAETGTTMVELNEQAAERYKKWDLELNEIYGVLKKQLSTEQLNKLKEEQRNWIKHRDEVAKEASLKYKGGSMESLEYVATQANLTQERCYELVEKYLK